MSQKTNKTNMPSENKRNNNITNMDDCHREADYSNSVTNSTYNKTKKQSNKTNKNNTTDCR